jgi:hypothetical protein
MTLIGVPLSFEIWPVFEIFFLAVKWTCAKSRPVGSWPVDNRSFSVTLAERLQAPDLRVKFDDKSFGMFGRCRRRLGAEIRGTSHFWRKVKI